MSMRDILTDLNYIENLRKSMLDDFDFALIEIGDRGVRNFEAAYIRLLDGLEENLSMFYQYLSKK